MRVRVEREREREGGRKEGGGGNRNSSAYKLDVFVAVICTCNCTRQVGLSGAGMERNVLYGVDKVSVGNRWMDKWVIVVTADGQVLCKERGF